MKFWIYFSCIFFVLGTQAQKLKKPSLKIPTGVPSFTNRPLSEEEIVRGLKEALSKGADDASGKASKVDAFQKNLAIKILWPEDARKIESKLRQLGMNQLCDDFILSMNRAAEEASKKAAPIFIDAIKNMSVNDAFGILKGSDHAATDYLKNTTTSALTQAFQPEIESALQKVNATKYWSEISSTYNKLPFTQPVNTNLADFVTEKAIQGLFVFVAEKEKAIRNNPLERTSELLKRVFQKP
jgi:hypothetical protein